MIIAMDLQWLLFNGWYICVSGMGIDREINLEAGLFEWLGWYQNGMPRLMTISEFRENGFHVSASNTQIWPTSKFNMAETTEQYYDRCHSVTKEILKRHELHGKSIYYIYKLYHLSDPGDSTEN